MAAHSQHAGLVVAVVLARAGSKGVPGKNTALVAGKPCVAWTIEHAMAAKAVDVVVVSSDCDEVLAIAGEMGALPHRRPDALAGDTARVDDALRDAVAWYEGDPQHPGTIGAAVLLYGNVPVRPGGLIDRGVALWQQTGCDSVQSYEPVGKYHPWWQTRVTGGSRRGRAIGSSAGCTADSSSRRATCPTAGWSSFRDRPSFTRPTGSMPRTRTRSWVLIIAAS
jgi:hypothetical protein